MLAKKVSEDVLMNINYIYSHKHYPTTNVVAINRVCKQTFLSIFLRCRRLVIPHNIKLSTFDYVKRSDFTFVKLQNIYMV